MKIKKVNIHDSIATRVLGLEVKDASGFIEDVTGDGNVVKPSLVRLRDEDAWRLYESSDWIMSVVNRIVRDCVKVKPLVAPKDPTKKITGRMKDRIKNINDFLDNPNNGKESFAEIREKYIRDMHVYGRGAIEKVNLPSGKLQEIYAQDPKYLEICSDIHGNIPEERAYRLKSPNVGNNKLGRRIDPESEVWFNKDELIHLVHNPISKSLYGVKILDGIANIVASDILRAAYNTNFFINGAEASGILSLEEMSEDKLKKFRAYYQQNFKGVKNAHRTMATNVPIKYVRMALSNRDLQFSEYGKELMYKIFAAYSTPAFILGLPDESGKDPKVQIELYKDGALRPVLSKESYYLTREIVQDGFGYDDICIGFASLDLIDRASQSNLDVAEAQSGITTINEIRRSRGLPDVRWGDTPISTMPGGGQVDPNSGKLIPPSQQAGAGGKLPATSKPKPRPANPRKKSMNRVLFRYNVFSDMISKMSDEEIVSKIIISKNIYSSEELHQMVEILKESENVKEKLFDLITKKKSSDLNLNVNVVNEKEKISSKKIKINRDSQNRPTSLEVIES